jgi:DNA-binding NtrC family response regulator
MKVVIVEDDKTLCGLLKKSLENEFNVTAFYEPEKALAHIKSAGTDAVVSDVRMPGMTGFELLEALREDMPEVRLILMTGYGTVTESVNAIKSGAYDYILKPVDPDILIKKLDQIRTLLDFGRQSAGSFAPIYKSKKIDDIMQLAARAAKADSGVLITGETGTGKEVIARFIHGVSSRKTAPFVAVNCGNMQEQLFESELFGYRKGAFTGADTNKRGLVSAAERGTLFLDEIGELPLPSQSKLLRFIETRTYYPLGSVEPKTANVRFIAATNRNPAEEAENGTFRKDLYYRLNVVEIKVPPLRDRKEDIMPLAEHFLGRFRHINPKIEGFSPDAVQALENYSYPGNVRELSNIIERAVILETGHRVSPASLHMTGSAERTVSKKLDDVVREHILAALAEAGGSKAKAAEILGIDASTIYRRLKEYGIN